jgi:hypothetical protein
MAEIAVAAGVPPGRITAGTRSRDTIGNIWFTKPLLGEPAEQYVMVVTSGWHAARALPGADDLGTRLPRGRGLASRRGRARGRPGRSLAGRRGCWRCHGAGSPPSAPDHPVYAGHPQTTLAELAATIAGHLRDRG